MKKKHPYYAKNVFILLIIVFSMLSLRAQKKVGQIRNTPNGKIIVFPDGSTQPFSIFSQGTSQAPQDNTTQPNSYVIFDADITPLDNPISVTEEDLAKIAFRRSQISQHAAEIAEARAANATQKRQTLENQLRNNRNLSKEQQKKLELELANARSIEEEAIQEVGQAYQLAEEAELFAKGGNYVETFIKEREARKKALNYSETKANNSSIDLPLPFGESYASPVDQDYYPEHDCQIAYEGMDESNGKWRRDIQKAPLFSHTDDRLRTYLKEKEYLDCNGFLTTTGGFYYLNLEFTFAYPNAREAYGIIEENSILTIKLLNGHYINLLSGKMAKGSLDLDTQILTYQVHYMIDRSQLNILKRSEVDTILVFWSTGYEEYQVYQMDFFMNQIKCLE